MGNVYISKCFYQLVLFTFFVNFVGCLIIWKDGELFRPSYVPLTKLHSLSIKRENPGLNKVKLHFWPIFSGTETKITFAVYVCVPDIYNREVDDH